MRSVWACGCLPFVLVMVAVPGAAADFSGRSASGSAAAVGGPLLSDFNGDGFADFALGAQSETVNGHTGAGGVNVLYGSAAGLQTDAPPDQFWTQDSPGVEDAAEPGDEFGSSFASGDFNGDGFDDVAIGARGESVGAAGNAGAVNLLYGSAAGLQTDAPADQFWTQDSPGVEDVAEAGDRLANSLAAGDFNGDGYADLATGALFEVLGSLDKAGSVNVLYGSGAGLQTDAPADQLWTQDSQGVKETAEAKERFGRELVAGDFNADGTDDLAIGTHFESLGTIDNAGAVNVLYGTAASGLQARSPDDQLWTQDNQGVRDQAEADDRFGSALAAGDLNADGYADLAVGVRYEDFGTVTDAGGVAILYGTADGLQARSPDDQFWTQDNTGISDEAETGDWFGYSLSIGDFNGDGFDDLLAGARLEDVGSVTDAGAANVIYGSAAGLASAGNQFWHQNATDVEDESEVSDELGVWLAAGDFDGNGADDAALAVWLEDVSAATDAGAANVIYGGAGGLQTLTPADQLWTQDSPGIDDQAEAGDVLGFSLTAGGR